MRNKINYRTKQLFSRQILNFATNIKLQKYQIRKDKTETS